VPGGFLCTEVDRDRTYKVRDRVEQMAGDFGDRSVGLQSDAMDSAVAVLGDGVMGVQVEGNDKCAGLVRSGQWEGLPAPCAEAQGSVLELRLGWCEGYGQFAEDLGVGVQRVAGSVPFVVRDRGPCRGHD
jgi:hypothetical protein